MRRKINEIKNKADSTQKEDELLTTLESVYEFYCRGFSFAPLDLYESDSVYFLRVGERQLRPPFVAVSGLGAAAAADLVACRAGGEKFVSIEELSAACPKVSKTHIELLKSVGALDDMPDTSQITLFDGF